MKRPEPVIQVKRRRDLALSVIVNQVPYIEFLGVSFDRHGDQSFSYTHLLAHDTKAQLVFLLLL